MKDGDGIDYLDREGCCFEVHLAALDLLIA